MDDTIGGGPMSGERPGIAGEALRSVTLVAATMTVGFTASVFVHWSNTIMPALGNVDDRAFVATFHELDAAITNPLFLGVGFMGALVTTGVAAALHLRAEHRQVLAWVTVALVCYLAALAITFGVHEPLNRALRTPGPLETDADFAAVRAQLQEAKWMAWNTVRAIAAVVAFGCLAGSLITRRR